MVVFSKEIKNKRSTPFVAAAKCVRDIASSPIVVLFSSVLFFNHKNVVSLGLPKQFLNKRAKKTKACYDKISEGITSSDPTKRFCVIVFLPMINILSCQLINRFEGMKLVVTSYSVMEPSFLSNASHLDLEVEA